jgi:predicted nucleotidyltransferase
MGLEKYDYTKYEGLPKDERRKRISEVAAESLETKRFLLSRNPKLKERIRVLHKVVDDLKEQYPEIISLNLFGSLVKGYANEESDFDAQIFIDVERNLAIQRSAYNELVKAVQEATGTNRIQVDHIFAKFITLRNIVDTAWITTGKDPLIRDLFLLATSRDINTYRAAVLNTLAKRGMEGERVWENIMLRLFDFENGGLPDELKEKRKKLYPQTIAEGRKYFPQGQESVR